MSPIRIAAIDFLNPAPLMWNFEHSPEREQLAGRYSIRKMTPAQCAARLAAGEAELGLIPIAAYVAHADLAIVPGCAIASLDKIRSILLVLRASRGEPEPYPASKTTSPDLCSPAILDALKTVRTVALDISSRTSAIYTRILFDKYWKQRAEFALQAPNLDAMLASADAALLIGDPALYALEDRRTREARTGEALYYLDLGDAWQRQTGLPWVSAFWAARVAGLGGAEGERRVVEDLIASRDAGLANLASLATEWSTRLKLPEATVTHYLGQNIHYHLDEFCLRGVERFYADAVECRLIEAAPRLDFL